MSVFHVQLCSSVQLFLCVQLCHGFSKEFRGQVEEGFRSWGAYLSYNQSILSWFNLLRCNELVCLYCSFLDVKEGRYNPKMSPKIPREKWRKGSQVISLISIFFLLNLNVVLLNHTGSFLLLKWCLVEYFVLQSVRNYLLRVAFSCKQKSLADSSWWRSIIFGLLKDWWNIILHFTLLFMSVVLSCVSYICQYRFNKLSWLKF